MQQSLSIKLSFTQTASVTELTWQLTYASAFSRLRCSFNVLLSVNLPLIFLVNVWFVVHPSNLRKLLHTQHALLRYWAQATFCNQSLSEQIRVGFTRPANLLQPWAPGWFHNNASTGTHSWSPFCGATLGCHCLPFWIPTSIHTSHWLAWEKRSRCHQNKWYITHKSTYGHRSCTASATPETDGCSSFSHFYFVRLNCIFFGYRLII